jgi:hypothetical protein
MYLNVQLPYAAVAVTSIAAHGFVAQLIIIAGGMAGQGFAAGRYERIVAAYVSAALLPIIYLTILRLHEQLQNPFGDDPCDFPCKSYLSGMLEGTVAANAALQDTAALRSLGVVNDLPLPMTIPLPQQAPRDASTEAANAVPPELEGPMAAATTGWDTRIAAPGQVGQAAPARRA